MKQLFLIFPLKKMILKIFLGLLTMKVEVYYLEKNKSFSMYKESVKSIKCKNVPSVLPLVNIFVQYRWSTIYRAHLCPAVKWFTRNVTEFKKSEIIWTVYWIPLIYEGKEDVFQCRGYELQYSGEGFGPLVWFISELESMSVVKRNQNQRGNIFRLR